MGGLGAAALPHADEGTLLSESGSPEPTRQIRRIEGDVDEGGPRLNIRLSHGP